MWEWGWTAALHGETGEMRDTEYGHLNLRSIIIHVTAIATKQSCQNWLSDYFPTECACSEITLYVSVWQRICDHRLSSSSSSSSLYHRPLSALDKDNTDHCLKKQKQQKKKRWSSSAGADASIHHKIRTCTSSLKQLTEDHVTVLCVWHFTVFNRSFSFQARSFKGL